MSALSLGAAPRPSRSRRRAGGITPYLLMLPAIVVLAVVAAWPIYKIVALSLQKQESSKYALFHSGGTTPFVGLENYVKVLGSAQFWTVTGRTLAFTAINVAISMLLGLAIALLLGRVSRWARIMLVTVLLFVWAIPSTVSSQVFYWIFSNHFGVANTLIDLIPGMDMAGHDWFADPRQGLAVITAVVVWGAIPMLAISLHAGITQIPSDVREAARCDGAGPWQSFWYVTFPALRPLLVVLLTLSIIWDFGVFNQVWFMRNGKPEPGYQVLGTYTYSVGVGSSQYNTGSTLGVLMMVALLAVMAVYIRQMFRIGDEK